jgi:predicted transcriptional regulator
MSDKQYKSWELYTCLALNRLARELEIDIYQSNIEPVLNRIFQQEVPGVPKAEISYEIKSNYQMTTKVLKKLKEDGLISIRKKEKKYEISITVDGVYFLRKYNTFYATLYKKQIIQHYRYQQIPSWFKKYKESL